MCSPKVITPEQAYLGYHPPRPLQMQWTMHVHLRHAIEERHVSVSFP
jgi:hypothetical protein